MQDAGEQAVLGCANKEGVMETWGHDELLNFLTVAFLRQSFRQQHVLGRSYHLIADSTFHSQIEGKPTSA